MNKKSTKRALLCSLLSLVVCLSMLVGTTFAWFTDNVVSANNIIQSGNLDVELEYWDGDSYEKVTPTTKLFNDAALWEPGYTEVAYLKISNAGSLALKYQLKVNVVDEIIGKTEAGDDIKLSDYLVFSVVDKEIASADDLYTREEAVAAAGETLGLKSYSSEPKVMKATDPAEYVALIIYMPTTVGNVANHDGENVPSIEMGVSLFATQATVESDSFGPDYDDIAWVVANADAVVNTQQELNEALADGGLIALNNDIEGNITLDNVAEDTIINFAGNTITGTVTVAEGQEVTLNGVGGVSATGTDPAIKVGKDTDVTVAGGTYTSERAAFSIANTKSEVPMTLTIEEGTVVNAQSVVGLDAINGYAGAEVVVNGGEFNTTGRPLKVDGGNVTINGGTFTIDNPTNSYTSIVEVSGKYNTGHDGTDKYVVGSVVINGGTFKSNVPYTRAVYASQSSSIAIPGYVEINGGTFEFTANYSYLVDAYAKVVVNDCTYVAINSANVFNGSSNNSTDRVIEVNGGNYTVRTAPRGSFISSSYNDNIVLKGGTINNNTINTETVATGYKVVKNTDGTYSVVAE